MSCNITTPDSALIPSTSAASGTVSTTLPNVSSSTPATPTATASASASASSNSDHPGNKTTGAAYSTSNKIERDRTTPARGEGGGVNDVSLSYFTFLLTVIGAYVMKVIEL